jgi:hypothetical protein
MQRSSISKLQCLIKLYNDNVSIAEIIMVKCNEETIMNGKYIRTWKDMVMQYFKTFSWLYAGQTDNPKTPKSR